MPAFVNVKKKGHLPAREKISFSVDGYDVVFISFICADLGAQVENVAADCAGVTIGRRTPEGLIQFLCGRSVPDVRQGDAAEKILFGSDRHRSRFDKHARWKDPASGF